ncbi:aspartyl/asparaginyl beta-hydroxylase domain-containing protein [Alteromonas sp. a30]|uniref:aspartyl/asparaginyl beta-hydroxylase domain-containing protein n=1 Tax=Alteromonas sp. a30 TaxID=2730917 RepID=UPI002281E99A|nr:aspartyl/asparaginyl beta-hydroxylase domain-containing protein [Alteromonas sp. a30]MCY7294918.1 aspartyl/asparaginyl beta-hydroxylase domain-containing protein [Alteromonas sp. a30]
MTESVPQKRPWTSYDLDPLPASEPDFWDKTQFEWVKHVEDNWEIIRDEMLEVMQTQDGILEPYKDLSKTNRKDAWKTAGLMYWTFVSDRYTKVFPKTWEVLKDIPHLSSASILLLEPNSTIRPHIGDTNAMMRCHMGLKVPAAAPRCGFKVNDTTVSWEEGGIFLFNDAQLHTAWNNTNENRYILSFDVLRPEFVKSRKWVASRVLGNIFLDVRYQHHPWLKKLGKRRWVDKILRRGSYALFSTMILLKKPLYNLF